MTMRVSGPITMAARQVRQSGHWMLSALCATLIPVVVVVIARFTDDGPARMFLTWVIALLMGVALYAFAVGTEANRRHTRSPASGHRTAMPTSGAMALEGRERLRSCSPSPSSSS